MTFKIPKQEYTAAFKGLAVTRENSGHGELAGDRSEETRGEEQIIEHEYRV